MFDNLGISKCDSKKSPTVQNYEVISFILTAMSVLQIKIMLVQYRPYKPTFFAQSRSQKLVQVLIAASNGDRMALER